MLVNTKIFSLKHPSLDLLTTFRRSSEQPFDFTMQVGDRKSTYLIVRSCIHVPGYVIIKADVHRENSYVQKKMTVQIALLE